MTVTPAQLPELLLHVAVSRPVFVWGQPGIGKSSLVPLAHLFGYTTALRGRTQGRGTHMAHPHGYDLVPAARVGAALRPTAGNR